MPRTPEQREKDRLRRAEYVANNREKVRAQQRTAYAAKREAIRTRRNAAYAANPAQAKTYNRTSYLRQRTKRLAERKAYVAAHAEEVRAAMQRWNESHKEERRAYNAQYREQHRDRLIQHSRAYHAAHPEQCREHARRRKARLRGAQRFTLSAAQWREIKDAFGHRCAYCGRKMQRLTQDHITPTIEHGDHHIHRDAFQGAACFSWQGNGRLAPTRANSLCCAAAVLLHRLQITRYTLTIVPCSFKYRLRVAERRALRKSDTAMLHTHEA